MVQIILEDGQHTFDASLKTITLSAPYTALSEGQILKIINLTTHAVIYEVGTQRYPISIAGAVITHTYDNTGMADADLLQIIVDVGGSASVPLTCSPPEMSHTELRVNTTAATDDLTPAAGKRIRVLGFCACSTVLSNLTSTLRATLAFGTGHTTDSSKILCSYRHVNTNNPLCNRMTDINVLGDVDEVVRLTNITYSVGSVITRVIVYYVEE